MTTTIQKALDKFQQSSNPANQDFLTVYEKFRSTGDPTDAILSPCSAYYWEVSGLGSRVCQEFVGDEDLTQLATIALLNVGKGKEDHPFTEGFLTSALHPSTSSEQVIDALLSLARELGMSEVEIAVTLALYCAHQQAFGWTEPELPHADSPEAEDFGKDGSADPVPPASLEFNEPVERYFAALDDSTLATALAATRKTPYDRNQAPAMMVATFALHRPAVMGPWIEKAKEGKLGCLRSWWLIQLATDRWDSAMIEAVPRMTPEAGLSLLTTLKELGRPSDLGLARSLALREDQSNLDQALLFLFKHYRNEFVPRFLEAIESGRLLKGYPAADCEEALKAAASIWKEGGEAVFQTLLDPAGLPDSPRRDFPGVAHLCRQATRALLTSRGELDGRLVESWFRAAIEFLAEQTATGSERGEARYAIWSDAAESANGLLEDDFKELLGDKAKGLRAIATQALKTSPNPNLVNELVAKLGKGKVDLRLGIAELLEAEAEPGHAEVLKAALTEEKSDKVRAALHRALDACGGSAEPDAEVTKTELSLIELEAEISKQSKRTKLPKALWLDLDKLPAFKTSDGGELSHDAAVFLISKQAKHKEIAAAPDVLPLLAHLDRETNVMLAEQLVQGFLHSEQLAADRWALALGGLLGDQRIIPLLLSRIQGWCENSRHKLAEYAAQAISLLPGDESLMVLDTLSTRYRSKFKNVGKACAAAFEAAATARGITPDELGDMVVPSFEFDEDGVRRFEWEGGGISAELGPDFKLQWFDPETEKSWKAIPAAVPAETRAEVKVLNKMIRETVKGQTARLELTLVRQRRWPVARWRELFESHPILRSFASRLVWGIYDASGKLLRTFRRYPNGLLADAEGALEELEESDVFIGMIHPLELDAAELEAWRAHLGRFKIKPPFPQLDRPVEVLDPLHGNRRVISVSRGKEVGAGTFKSRSEKRGWIRGSVVDAGGISSVYKAFPGVGIEAILPTNDYWVGIDPTDTVGLEDAYFVKSESVDRGSYIYDDPGPDDERVLRFDQVPAIVYSETVADLKAITYKQEK